MTVFASLRIAGSGMDVYQTWIEAVSDNVANINTIRPSDEPAFQERLVHASSVPGGNDGVGQGARVSGIEFGDPEGQMVYDPQHPFADENGMIRRPAMDMSELMTDLIVAQRSYEANVTTFERARDSYKRALEIGR